MIPSLNTVLAIGRLVADPELRYTSSGTAVGEFRLAVNRSYQTAGGEKREETVFVGVTTWGRTAEACAGHLTKGSQVLVDGRLHTREGEGRDGQKRSALEVVAENVQFLSVARHDDRPVAVEHAASTSENDVPF